MDFVLATLCGIIVTTMNVFNGQLSDYTGVYLSTVIIHLVGLVTFLIIMKIKDKKVCFKKQIPLYMYCGGCIGVLTNVIKLRWHCTKDSSIYVKLRTDIFLCSVLFVLS